MDASFTFLANCLVGTEHKVALSKKADMRLQLRSLAWHTAMNDEVFIKIKKNEKIRTKQKQNMRIIDRG